MTENRPAGLTLQAASRKTRYDELFRDIDLHLEPGDLCVLLGARQAGKSALLRCIAGLDPLTGGSVHSGEDDISSLPPNRRGIAYMAQDYPLWPDLTVVDNVGFPLRGRSLGRREIRKRAEEELAMVGLSEFSRHMPTQLNDAQRQRVALARTLVDADHLCLLDEPFSAQSPALRTQLARLVRRRQQLTGLTLLLASEDADTALRIADRVAVMHDGNLVQLASPQTVYDHPVTREAARLTGTANLIDGEIKLAAGQAIFSSDKGLAVPLFDDQIRRPRNATACFRPGALHIIGDSDLPGSDDIRVAAKILETEFLGDRIRYRLDVSGHVLWMDVPRRDHAEQLARNTELSVGLDPTQICVFEQ